MVLEYLVEDQHPGIVTSIRCTTIEGIKAAITAMKAAGCVDWCIMERQTDGSWDCACSKFRGMFNG